MVTHNPELAEKYSTCIIRMLDGEITDDSAPFSEAETAAENQKDSVRLEANNKEGKKEKMPSMSFATSFTLSLKNLFTIKGRTALTSFAGSIGIIGIALIFAVSHGMYAVPINRLIFNLIHLKNRFCRFEVCSRLGNSNYIRLL